MRNISHLLLLVLLGLGGALLLVEGAVRLLPAPRFAANIVYDPLLGNLGPKNSFVDFPGNRVYYNQLGYRDRPYDPAEERANKKFRIATLGDSITEAISLDDKSLWPFWMMNVLNSAVKQEVSAYKFAASDWGTYQEALAFQRDASVVEPQAVVMEFLGLNDYINNSLAFAEHNASENDGWRPFFNDLRPNNPPTYLHPLSRFFLVRSAIFRWAYSYYVSNHVYGLQTLKSGYEACDPYLELFLEKNKDPKWAQAFAATNGIAKKIGEFRKPGQLFVAVYFPSVLEVSPSTWKSAVAGPMERCAPGESLNPRQGELIFETAFRAAGVETFSLFDAFAKAKNPEQLFDPSGHLTARGHQLAGEQIAFYLYNKHADIMGGKR
jgi:hypothetical protein